MKKKVLFLCTGNSCRSQMAEGLLRHYFGETYEAYSAGTEPTHVNPYATEVMAEIGIDIRAQDSKHVNVLADVDFDTAITVCDNAKQSCPIALHSQTTINWSFYDPAEARGNKEEILGAFRTVRNEIKRSIISQFCDIKIMPAVEADYPLISQILKGNGLPYDDINNETISLFIAYKGSSAIGIGGIEQVGDVGLLRSTVVLNEFRNSGYGSLLLQLIEEKARMKGVLTLYLLTESAQDFFKKNGFEFISRKEVPSCIRHTRQFSELCPCTANCMVKRI